MNKRKKKPLEGTETSQHGPTFSGPGSAGPGGIDEAQLVEKARKGNMAAFGQLVQAYQDRLYNAILRMVGNPDDALELSQDAFIRALQALRNFRGQSGFYTWLFRIGMNLAINHQRRRQSITFSSLLTDEDYGPNQADVLRTMADRRQPGPDDQAELREEHRRVLAALQELDGDARAIVVLRDIEQLSYADIANILEVPAGTVKSRLCRARQALRDILSAQDNPTRLKA